MNKLIALLTATYVLFSCLPHRAAENAAKDGGVSPSVLSESRADLQVGGTEVETATFALG